MNFENLDHHSNNEYNDGQPTGKISPERLAGREAELREGEGSVLRSRGGEEPDENPEVLTDDDPEYLQSILEVGDPADPKDARHRVKGENDPFGGLEIPL